MKLSRILLAGVAALSLVGAAQAQQFFRIGTGGTAGTYYPVGGMIANAVSQPGKLVVTAQASNGSLANVTGIAGGDTRALATLYERHGPALWSVARAFAARDGLQRRVVLLLRDDEPVARLRARLPGFVGAPPPTAMSPLAGVRPKRRAGFNDRSWATRSRLLSRQARFPRGYHRWRFVEFWET